MYTSDNIVRIELIYTAAIVNDTNQCVEKGVINYKFENKVLSRSADFDLNKCPGGAGKHWARDFLVNNTKIKPENLDDELASGNKLFNELLSDLSINNASCEWYPQ